MLVSDLAPRYIREIAPYTPGKPISELARELDLDEAKIVKLASNENPLGMSPKALAAITKLLPELALYPDGNAFALKAALAHKWQLGHDNIVVGNGSNDILELAARSFLTRDDSAVYSQHAFAVYPLAVQAVGARGIEVPAHAFGHDLDAMVAAVEPGTRLMFIANPNNPTGTFIEPALLLAALKRVPAHVLVVLDEAYTEFLSPEQRVDSSRWLAELPNLLISRTFSKAYGLAGLRVGYALGNPDVVALLNRVRQPFNVNQLALAAAVAALDDDEFLARSYEVNKAGMVQLLAGFAALGLDSIPSWGNFVSVRIGQRGGGAAAVWQYLLKRGVIVRPVASYGMPEYLRISIGTAAQNATFLEVLAPALAVT